MSQFLRKNGAWIGFLILAVIITVLTDGSFLSPRNLTNLLRQTAINGILAAGMTLIILTGGIDLSIGSLVAMCGVIGGLSQVNWGWMDNGYIGALGSVAMAVGAGGLAGFVTGGLVSLVGIPPFVITLGMMVIARGLAMIFSNGASISPMGDVLRPIGGAYLPGPFSESIFSTSSILIFTCIAVFLYQSRRSIKDAILPLVTFLILGYSFLSYKGFPVPVLFLLFCMGVISLLLNHTTLGRSIYAVGSNESAAHWAGVSVKKVKWLVYTIMGLLSGLAGILLAGRLNSAAPTAGNLFELDAIAAVVIGGTSLKGGTGTIMGSLVGALTIAALNNGMDLLSIPSFHQMVLKGVIIIGAVSMDKGQRNS